MQFDPNIPGYMQGDVTNVTVIDPALTVPPHEVGNHVIDPTKSFDVKIEWEIFGLQVPLYLSGANQFWDVAVYGESIGSSPEILLGNVSKDKANTVACNINSAQPNCTKYEATVTVPPDTLEVHTAGTAQSGIYKLAVAVFLNSNLGTPGFDLIGFTEGPYIQAENPL